MSDDEISPGNIPVSGGFLRSTDTIITIKAAQVHGAVGISGDHNGQELDFKNKIPILFIVGGVSMGNEPLNERGQVAVALQPETSLATIHAVLMGLLSEESVDKVMALIYQLGDQDDKNGAIPQLFIEAEEKADKLRDHVDRSNIIDEILHRIINNEKPE